MVAEAPPVNPKHGQRISILTKTKARNLFFFQDANHARIAEETGLTLKAVGDLVSRSGWAKEKRERERRLAKAHDARIIAVDSEVVEAIASEAEQHAMSGLAKVGESLKRDDQFAAKDFQAYASGVKSLVSVARECRAPAGELSGSGNGSTLNLFFVAPPPVQQASEKAVVEIETQKSE